MMRLSNFKKIIANMPVWHQAFTSKKTTWKLHMRGDAAGEALISIFGSSEKVTISRSDLRSLAGNSDLAKFVMATIVWGYPNGMRGNNVDMLIGDLQRLLSLLSSIAREQLVVDWRSHYKEMVVPIRGIGLSTYTKFLSFLSVEVQGRSALILDDRIIRICNQRLFEELAPLERLNDRTKVELYPIYLECIHRIASSLGVCPEKIEFFLFEFGLNLKPLRSQQFIFVK